MNTMSSKTCCVLNRAWTESTLCVFTLSSLIERQTYWESYVQHILRGVCFQGLFRTWHNVNWQHKKRKWEHSGKFFFKINNKIWINIKKFRTNFPVTAHCSLFVVTTYIVYINAFVLALCSEKRSRHERVNSLSDHMNRKTYVVDTPKLSQTSVAHSSPRIPRAFLDNKNGVVCQRRVTFHFVASTEQTCN